MSSTFYPNSEGFNSAKGFSLKNLSLINMFWLLPNLLRPYPKPKYIWIKVRMRYETEKAILVLCDDSKIWVPKSRIGKVKLCKGWFWVYVRGSDLF